MNIGKEIKELRLRSGKRQGVFGAEIGITQTYLSQIESGKRMPSLEVIQKIVDSSGGSIVVLIFKSLTVDDVSEGKKEIFNLLKPSIDKLIDEIF